MTIFKLSLIPWNEQQILQCLNNSCQNITYIPQILYKSLTYTLVDEEGPAHDRRFKVEVMIDDIIYGVGIGTSKKEAEQEAAKEALEKLAVK